MKAVVIWTRQHNAELPATCREKATQRVVVPSNILVKFPRGICSLWYQHYTNPNAVGYLAFDCERGRPPLRMGSKNEMCHFTPSSYFLPVRPTWKVSMMIAGLLSGFGFDFRLFLNSCMHGGWHIRLKCWVLSCLFLSRLFRGLVLPSLIALQERQALHFHNLSFPHWSAITAVCNTLFYLCT